MNRRHVLALAALCASLGAGLPRRPRDPRGRGQAGADRARQADRGDGQHLRALQHARAERRA
ncbi:hypothetical protein ACU4GA_32330 [Methylobacterium oryzae CBMB20]